MQIQAYCQTVISPFFVFEFSAILVVNPEFAHAAGMENGKINLVHLSLQYFFYHQICALACQHGKQ
jgi:hypothetical protein